MQTEKKAQKCKSCGKRRALDAERLCKTCAVGGPASAEQDVPDPLVVDENNGRPPTQVAAVMELTLVEASLPYPAERVTPPRAATEQVIGTADGPAGLKFTVRLDPNGTVWCDCTDWLWSKRRPRTCQHISAMVPEGLVPEAYAMAPSEQPDVPPPGAARVPVNTPTEPRQAPSRSAFKRPLEEMVGPSNAINAAFRALRKAKVLAARAMRLVDVVANGVNSGVEYAGYAATDKFDWATFEGGGNLVVHVVTPAGKPSCEPVVRQAIVDGAAKHGVTDVFNVVEIDEQ